MQSSIQSAQDLVNSFNNSPYPSLKATNYFKIYADLFSHLRGTDCTFIETGILNGGSLFMWRDWLGPKARIIGLDLNPNAVKWKNHGFEIYIGDQGDPSFWQEIFNTIGNFDVLLDDGGHQSFQQIVTLVESLKAVNPSGLIVVEDTITSYMKEFAQHGNNCFLNYAKAATDTLVARSSGVWPDDFYPVGNKEVMEQFSKIYSIEFFSSIVAFKIEDYAEENPRTVWNKAPERTEFDYRSAGTSKSVSVNWPNPFSKNIVTIRGY
jgi:hypothetical protein